MSKAHVSSLAPAPSTHQLPAPAPAGSTSPKSTERRNSGIFNLFGSGDGKAKVGDFKITVTAMTTGTGETVCSGDMQANGINEVTGGNGNMNCTELSFEEKSKKSVLEVPKALADTAIVDCVEVKVEAAKIEKEETLRSPPLNYRIVIHRSENELNRAMGSASSKVPLGPRASKISIYPLLNNIYEEVGSVELEVIWGHPDSYMSKTKIDSIIHESGAGLSSNVSSYSVNTTGEYNFDDPLAKVRESMRNNKTWMSRVDEEVSVIDHKSDGPCLKLDSLTHPCSSAETASGHRGSATASRKTSARP